MCKDNNTTITISLYHQQVYEWTQAVLIHGAGPWGHGVDGLVLAGDISGITFPITIEIPDNATQSEVEALLSHESLFSYEVFVAHVTSDLV